MLVRGRGWFCRDVHAGDLEMKATGLLKVLQVGKREFCILERGVISELPQSEVQF